MCHAAHSSTFFLVHQCHFWHTLAFFICYFIIAKFHPHLSIIVHQFIILVISLLLIFILFTKFVFLELFSSAFVLFSSFFFNKTSANYIAHQYQCLQLLWGQGVPTWNRGHYHTKQRGYLWVGYGVRMGDPLQHKLWGCLHCVVPALLLTDCQPLSCPYICASMCQK